MSGYETPSAYAEIPAVPSAYTRYASPPYSNQVTQRPFISRPASGPASRESLERAVENLQAHLAALHERLDVLEGHGARVVRPNPSVRRVNDEWDLDLNDLGLWSMVFSPVTNVGIAVRQLARFMFASSVKRSPVLVVIRRLSLDLSFIFCVIAILRALWHKTGVRRREVNKALKLLGMIQICLTFRCILTSYQDAHCLEEHRGFLLKIAIIIGEKYFARGYILTYCAYQHSCIYAISTTHLMQSPAYIYWKKKI